MNEINRLKGDHLVKIAEYQQKFKSVLDKQSEDQKEQIQPKKKIMRKTTAEKAENEAQEEKPS